MTMKITIQNEMTCGTVFLSLLKKFIHKLENLCQEAGVCSIANIQLGETPAEEGRIKEAKFDVTMSNGHVINIATTAKTLEDAISNAFDACTRQITKATENTL
jgi:ribosome-associated translation inhibitor RaiA